MNQNAKQEQPSRPKNIVILSDGTGQEGGEEGKNTNIYKLFNMLEDRTDRQITFYDRGLGTGSRKMLGMATGFGISENILECYEFIFNHFEAGDQIYLFGFSRGATTVRSLSAFIHMFGILPKSRPELIERAYEIYKQSGKGRKQLAENFVKGHHTMWTKVKYLGVWDTVAALGVPFRTAGVLLDKLPFFRHRFHNLSLSKSVEHARHALAIDDERQTFHPQLWDGEIDEAYQTMKQVWFCGMHTDVGGGYKEQELSDIALQWMVDEAMQYGLRIYPKHKIKLNFDPDGHMHNSRGSFLTRLYRHKVRTWDAHKMGQPVVHESVQQRSKNSHNTAEPQYKPWIFEHTCDVEPWTPWPEGKP